MALGLLSSQLFACQQPPVTGADRDPSHGQPTTPAPTLSSDGSQTERLNQWLDARYEEKLSRSPMTKTMIGRKEQYDQIDEYSEEAADEQLKWLASSVDDLEADFNYDTLPADAKVSYDIWVYQYEAARAIAPFRRSEYVFTQMAGVHAHFPTFLINFHRVDNESDMRAYIARIGGISRAIGQLLERAQLAASEGVRPPRFAYEAVIQESKNLLEGAPFKPESKQDAPLWSNAQSKIAALVEAEEIDSSIAAELRASARRALQDNFGPAYRNLIAWLQSDIANAERDPRGVGALRDGKAFYNAKLAQATTTKLSAEEIHSIGLGEVSRIRGEMEALKAETGFEGTLRDFFTFVKTDPQFVYSNDADGRQGYLDDSRAYLQHIHSKLPDFFGLLPETDLIVKRVESFREQDGAAQHYMGGSKDGSRPGVYYAHLSDMRSMPKNEMEAIAYHEGNPGHHLQFTVAQELTGVPNFRTRAFFTSYNEGWGLYAESLAKERGAYKSPYTDFGRLLAEMWRAIRLVVDTGIHAKDWNEEKAVAYFKANSALSDGQIRAEVRRYFVWPGQATAYKIGMLKILELRERARAELGDHFDIRGFHDAVLGGGAVPLSVLERLVDGWIAAARDS